jgi:two-component system, response regulator
MNQALQEVEVLLVEDTATDAELCIRTLKKHSISNKIVWVKDGAEALDYFFGGSPDAEPRATPRLILLDLHLPKVSGFEVLQRLKQDPHTKSIPVVVLTSSNEDRDIVESYDLGVNSYVSKPVEFSLFVQTVTQLGLYWLITNHSPSQIGLPGQATSGH